MTDHQQFWVLIVHAAVSVIVITATSVLTALDKLQAEATTAIFGAAIGLVGGIQAARAATNGNKQPPAEGAGGEVLRR